MILLTSSFERNNDVNQESTVVFGLREIRDVDGDCRLMVGSWGQF